MGRSRLVCSSLRVEEHMPKKRKDGSLLGNLARAYQGHVSVFFVGAVMACRMLPGEGFRELREVATKMTSLSYPVAGSPGHYSNGKDDLYLVAFLAIFFVFLRIVLKTMVFDAIAKLGPCDTEKFTMQGWQFIYYLSAWVYGFYLYYNCEYWLDMPKMWLNYPQNTNMTADFKLYYICQCAFWVQMVFVTLIEKWQKDFVQMMAHHFITIGLVSSSYFTGFTRVGHAILVEQDFGDIFLPCAKMFKYFNEAADAILSKAAGKVVLKSKNPILDKLKACEEDLKNNKKSSKEWGQARKDKTMVIQKIVDLAKESGDEKTLAAAKLRDWRLLVHGNICDAFFAAFVIVWIPTRHGLFLWIYYSIYAHCAGVIKKTGLWGFHPEQGGYMTEWTVPIYLVALGIFQGLMVMWLLDIIKAVKRALLGPKNITDIEDPHEADSDDETLDFLLDDKKAQ